MKTLKNRRKISDASFLNKILQNKVNCPYLMNQISLRVPRRIMRYNPTFSIVYRLLCRKNSFMLRALELANRNNLYDDLIMPDPLNFKNFIRSVF